MSIFGNVHTHTRTRTHMHTHMQTREHTHTCTDARTHIHSYMHTHMHTHEHTHTYTHAHMHIREYTHTHIHIHTYTRISTHMNKTTYTRTHTCSLTRNWQGNLYYVFVFFFILIYEQGNVITDQINTEIVQKNKDFEHFRCFSQPSSRMVVWFLRCPSPNGRRKWTWLSEFKSWTKWFELQIMRIPLRKTWIQLFFRQLWVNNGKDWALWP